MARDDNRRPRRAGPEGEAWRLGRQAIWLMLRGYGELLDIKAHPHAFRHSLATTLLNHGADTSLVQEVLGYSSPTVTRQVYAVFEQRTLREAVKRHRPTRAPAGG